MNSFWLSWYRSYSVFWNRWSIQLPMLSSLMLLTAHIHYSDRYGGRFVRAFTPDSLDPTGE